LSRRPFQGALQILRYNWGFYVTGIVGLTIGLGLLVKVPWPRWLFDLGAAGLGLGAWWLLASILVSYWIYDASNLMEWGWLTDRVESRPGRWVNLHAGLDESSPSLAKKWGPPLQVFDIFDPTEMTEPSILRARKTAVNELTPVSVSPDELPLAAASIDLACVLFAAHELRSHTARLSFFHEVRRVLATGGTFVVVEHLRDPANFIAFGPGFMHFMAQNEWKLLGRKAGFRLVAESRKTPFVKLLLFQKT